MVPKFSHNKGNLRNRYSDKDLFTASWSFFSSLVIFLYSVSIKRCEKITRGVDRGAVHSTYYVTQIAVLTCDIISNAPIDNTINRLGVLYTCQYIT